MEHEGLVVVMEDEAFFVHDAATGRKYRSPAASPVTMPYTGSHMKAAAYRSIARDGRQFFRTYDRLTQRSLPDT